MDFLGSWARMSEQPVPACARLCRAVPAFGGGVLSIIISYALRSEAWKLQSSRPGLMSWLVDPAGLDWLADWLIGMDWKIWQASHTLDAPRGRRIKKWFSRHGSTISTIISQTRYYTCIATVLKYIEMYWTLSNIISRWELFGFQWRTYIFWI